MELGKRIKTEKKEKFHDFEHRQKITEMLKIIHMCPMDEYIKMVMRCRVWGLDPKVFKPLEAHQIAFIGKVLHNRIPTQKEIRKIEEIEEQGKFMCEQYLLSRNAQDIVNSFNKNSTKNKGQMFGVQPFERKRFSV